MFSQYLRLSDGDQWRLIFLNIWWIVFNVIFSICSVSLMSENAGYFQVWSMFVRTVSVATHVSFLVSVKLLLSLGRDPRLVRGLCSRGLGHLGVAISLSLRKQ